MNQWEIWTWQDHPAVIVSHPARIMHKPVMEIVTCSTARANRVPREGEILLDSADGLSWETLCYCDLIYSVTRAELVRRRGLVTVERRRAIVSQILKSHGWLGL